MRHEAPPNAHAKRKPRNRLIGFRMGVDGKVPVSGKAQSVIPRSSANSRTAEVGAETVETSRIPYVAHFLTKSKAHLLER